MAKTPAEQLAEMTRKLAEAEAQIEAMKKAKSGKVTLKVSELGALSVYGMGRFPTTLYASQWESLLADDQTVAIKAFIAAHKADFATGKDDPRFLKVRADRAAKAEAEAAKASTGGTATAPKAGSPV